MSASMRYATCNEIYGQTPLPEVCRQVKELGYEGIEIAPFTLSPDPISISAEDRSQIRQTIEQAGLCFVGLHWLLAAPPGLHLTSPDAAVRQHSWQYLHGLIDLCADLSVCREEYHSVMVLGSPKQRTVMEGISQREALDIFTHELAHAAPHAESRGVRILVEALSPDQTNFITTLAEANDIVRQIGSPSVQTMFDTHNAVREADSHPELIRRYSSVIQHVHVNEMDGREPGTGSYDFAAVLNALANIKYSGWVSLEVIDVHADPQQIARNSINYLQSVQPEWAMTSQP
jgi:D-psicose/D-tagatose/L-ribulose 3-epimerase